MARPRKQVSEQRICPVKISLTEEEFSDLKKKAMAAGQAPAVYARDAALQSRLVIHQGRGLSPETFDTLNRLGVNLNQIARALNTGLDGDLYELRDTLKRINAALDLEAL